MKIYCLLVLFATESLYVHSAPTHLPSEENYDQLDFSKTYLQFFKIKDLIEKINIKKFREIQSQGIEDNSDSHVAEDTGVNEDNIPEDPLPEIDLTEEAIINDKVNGNVQLISDTSSASVTTELAVYEESTASSVETTGGSIETATEEKGGEVAATVATPTDGPEIISLADDTAEPLPIDFDPKLNEIDTGNSNRFFISKESVESARKYGYKILLKKVGGKEIPVGKIKFSLPTLVEIDPTVKENIDDDQSNVNSGSESPELENVVPELTTVNEIEEAETKASVPTESYDGVEPSEPISTTEEPLESYGAANSGVEAADPEAITEITYETTTALSVVFTPPPLEAVIPTVDQLDENTITEGVKQITEDTEVAIMEIKNQNPTETVVFEECAAPITDIENMLMNLAKIIEKQTPMISEILSVGKSLKDETSPEVLSRSGAKLLKLLEPFLESLVPAELSGCAAESSDALLISLSGMASHLDTIASNEVNEDKASSLHKSATSLQLAAWVMAQLQSSVHTFYSQEGICGSEESSTTEILGSLSKAITGYIPIVTMLGNEESVAELKDTIDALDKAKVDIAELEAKSGTRLPGVECGASFSEMAEALENLADFVKALSTNEV